MAVSSTASSLEFTEKSHIIIALDAMGGDRGMEVVVPAALLALKKNPYLKLILVGDEPLLRKKLGRRLSNFAERLIIQHASEIVAMDESPAKALRYKKDSSMRVAINLVKQGQAHACVSAGNTGALMATARFVLKTLPGVDKPAIIGMIPAPTAKGYVRMLDLGANVDASAYHLFQFAIMASAMTSAVEGIEYPRIALLNVGEEEIKGNEAVKDAAKLLAETPNIRYVGFAEGNDIFSDKADIIVTDGFTGNVALKTSEGLARFIRAVILESFKKNIFTQFAAFICLPVLNSLRRRLNPAMYNGASLLGLRGIVIKSHGGTTVQGFAQAIQRAMLEAEYDVPNRIEWQVANLLKCSDYSACMQK